MLGLLDGLGSALYDGGLSGIGALLEILEMNPFLYYLFSSPTYLDLRFELLLHSLQLLRSFLVVSEVLSQFRSISGGSSSALLRSSQLLLGFGDVALKSELFLA